MRPRIRNVVMATKVANYCLVCDAPRKGRARAVELAFFCAHRIICIPCARRIGKAAEVKP